MKKVLLCLAAAAMLAACGDEMCIRDRLCTSAEEGEGKCAYLKGMSFGVYAAGNLFTGKFDFVGAELSGYARFGQVYAFEARPRALRLRYKATVNPIGEEGLGLKPGASATDIDEGRIFVCITDWSERHSVCSGLILSGIQQEQGTDAMIEKMNPFDPVKMCIRDRLGQPLVPRDPEHIVQFGADQCPESLLLPLVEQVDQGEFVPSAQGVVVAVGALQPVGAARIARPRDAIDEQRIDNAALRLDVDRGIPVVFAVRSGPELLGKLLQRGFKGFGRRAGETFQVEEIALSLIHI